MAYQLSQFWLFLCAGFLLTGAGGLVFFKRKIVIDILNISTTVVLAYLSFYIHIYGNFYDDIIRISEDVVAVHFRGISSFLEQYAGNPLVLVLYAIASFLGDTRFVSVISVALSYGLYFISLSFFCRRKKIMPIVYLILSFFALNALNFVSCAFNIRFTLAFSLVMFSIELGELFKPKIMIVLIQLLAVSLHNGMVPIFIIYVIVKYYNDRLYKKLLIILIAWGSFAKFLFPLLQSSSIAALSSFGNKGVSYFVEGNSFDQNVNFSRWAICFCYLLFLVILVCFLFIEMKIKSIESKFLVGLALFSLGAIPMGYTALARYAGAGVVAAVFVVGAVLNQYLTSGIIVNGRRSLKAYGVHIIIISIFIFTLFLILVNWYSNMSQYYLDFQSIPSFSYQFK